MTRPTKVFRVGRAWYPSQNSECAVCPPTVIAAAVVAVVVFVARISRLRTENCVLVTFAGFRNFFPTVQEAECLVSASVCIPSLPSACSSCPICILEKFCWICCKFSLWVANAMTFTFRSSAIARMFCSKGVKPSSFGSHHRTQLSSLKSSAMRLRIVMEDMYLYLLLALNFQTSRIRTRIDGRGSCPLLAHATRSVLLVHPETDFLLVESEHTLWTRS